MTNKIGVVVITARTTPPSGIFPFHTVISFIFRRWDGGGYACHQCIQPQWKSWRKFWLLGYFRTSQKDVIKWTSFIRLASFKPISTTLTYSPVKLLFDGFVPRKKISEWVWERCTLSLKSAYRTYNVLCFEGNYHLKWYYSNKYAREFSVANIIK